MTFKPGDHVVASKFPCINQPIGEYRGVVVKDYKDWVPIRITDTSTLSQHAAYMHLFQGDMLMAEPEDVRLDTAEIFSAVAHSEG